MTLESKSEIKITFAGGATTPTGSNFLVNVGDKNFLVDCGLYQGEHTAEADNHKNFSYDVTTIDAVFVTHGHLDHVGRIPKLYHDGYRGVIYSTPPTKEIGELIMLDSLHLLTKEAERKGLLPMYTEDDVQLATDNWHTQKYHDILPIHTSLGVLKIKFLDAGHIMGSSMIVFELNGKKLVFSGDLGNTPSPMLRDTESIKGVDYLVMESVYGDRNHEDVSERVQKLQEVFVRTIRRGGTLMIPAFSVERTQELLYQLNNMIEAGKVPKCPIYLDSPLGIKVTKVYKKYEKDYMNSEIYNEIRSGDDIFSFPGLKIAESKEESMMINNDTGPKVIVAGSGMSNGGRIVHHEARYLSDKRATLLLVGYQAVGTLGRSLYEGNKKVIVNNQEVNVRCEIVMIGGFSAHKDSQHLLEFAAEAASTLKQVFVVLGEPKSAMFLAQRLNEYYDVPVKLPQLGETVTLQM